MGITAICCSGGGDSGKAKVCGWFAKEADMMIRVQGGANRGGECQNQYGKTVVHMVPSGVFNPECTNVIATAVAFDMAQFFKEIDDLESKNLNPRIFVSNRVCVVLPYHIDLNIIEEARLGKNPMGSTCKGVTQMYSDQVNKIAIQVNELYESDEYLLAKLWHSWALKDAVRKYYYDSGLIDETLKISHPEENLLYIKKYRDRLKPYLADTRKMINDYIKEDKKIYCELSLGSQRDLFHGNYNHVTSSSCLASFAATSAGIAPYHITKIVALIKSYSTTVGSGPFVTQLTGESEDKLVELGDEYGRTSGNRRHCGRLDLVMTKCGVELQGATDLCLTRLDILGDEYFKELPVCVAYKYKEGPLKGQITSEFLTTLELEKVEPIYEILPGWQCDISNCEKYEDLPENAKKYVNFIEDYLGMKIKYISNSPDSNKLIVREDV